MPSSMRRREAEHVLAVQFLGDAREGRGELARLGELEVPAAGLVGDLPQTPVGLRPLTQNLALEADRVNHHFLGARAIDDLAQAAVAAARVVAVGEDEDHAAAVDALQFIQARRDGIPETRGVAVVEVLDVGDELIAIVHEPRVELDPVVERADPRLVGGQQAVDELFGRAAKQVERQRHAAARVEHDDDRDRLHLVLEEDERLGLLVVEDLEIVLHEIGDEALLRVGHRGEHRDDLGAGLERRLLRGEGRQAQAEARGRRRLSFACPQLIATAEASRGRVTGPPQLET